MCIQKRLLYMIIGILVSGVALTYGSTDIAIKQMDSPPPNAETVLAGLFARYEFEDIINDADEASDTSGFDRHAHLEKASVRQKGILGRSLYLSGQGNLSLVDGALSKITNFTFSAFVFDDGIKESCVAELSNTNSGISLVFLISPLNSNSPLEYKLVRELKEMNSAIKTEATTEYIVSHTKEVKQTEDIIQDTSSRCGKWRHIAITQSANSAAIFVNGLEVARKNGKWATLSELGINRLTIGNSTAIPHRSFHGSLDQVQLFNRELTAAEIRRLARIFTVQGRTIYRGNTPWYFKGVALSCLTSPHEIISETEKLGFAGSRNNWIESVKAKAKGAPLDFDYPGPEITLDRIQSWSADSVRFLVSQIGLVGGTADNGRIIDNLRYSQDVKDAVNKCLSRGLSVVIAMQYQQHSGRSGQLPMPVKDTIMAWDALTVEFANDPLVIFEIFNEPNVFIPGPRNNMFKRWKDWAEGGVSPGGIPFYGMQQMVDIFRADRGRGFNSHNLLFVDGIEFAKTLEGVRALKDTAGALAYAFHPYSTESWMSEEEWKNDWTQKFLKPSRTCNIPIVNTEWFTRPDLKFDVWNSFTPRRIVALLQFMKDNQIGFYPFTFDIIGWLTVGFTDHPTSIYRWDGSLPPAGPGAQFGIGRAVHFFYTMGIRGSDWQALEVPLEKDL